MDSDYDSQSESDNEIEELEYNLEDDDQEIYHDYELIVAKNRQMSKNVITILERTQLIVMRAEQIRATGLCLVDTDGLTDVIQMAEKELKEKKLPIKIHRHIPVIQNGKIVENIEEIDPNDPDILFATL